MPLEGNDFIPPLCIQSKYSSLFTHWNMSNMSRGLIVPIIQKPKKMEKVGSFRKNNAMTFVAIFFHLKKWKKKH